MNLSLLSKSVNSQEKSSPRQIKSNISFSSNIKHTPRSDKSSFYPPSKINKTQLKSPVMKSPTSPKQQDGSSNIKLNQILQNIQYILTDDQKQTQLLVKNIDKQVNAINKRFSGKTLSKKETEERVLFTNQEKQVMIRSYDQAVDSMFTNKNSGIKFFKQKILKENEQLL